MIKLAYKNWTFYATCFFLNVQTELREKKLYKLTPELNNKASFMLYKQKKMHYPHMRFPLLSEHRICFWHFPTIDLLV
jgi:hypothetical protein